MWNDMLDNFKAICACQTAHILCEITRNVIPICAMATTITPCLLNCDSCTIVILKLEHVSLTPCPQVANSKPYDHFIVLCRYWGEVLGDVVVCSVGTWKGDVCAVKWGWWWGLKTIQVHSLGWQLLCDYLGLVLGLTLVEGICPVLVLKNASSTCIASFLCDVKAGIQIVDAVAVAEEAVGCHYQITDNEEG